MARQAKTAAGKRNWVDGYALTAVVLFVCLIISFIACINTPPHESLDRFLLICTLGFFFSSSLFFVFWALRHNKREALGKLGHEHPPVFNLNEDYRAKHDVSDVILYAIMGGGMLFVAVEIGPNGHWLMGSVCMAMALFGFVMLYKSLFFSVLFTDKLMVVALKPFISYSESYDSVTAIHFMPNNRKVIFADGKSVNLGYGFGDSRRIAAILKKRVDVLPEERWHWL
ncbi:MAG: hypothetical protein JST28_04790 [Acidobacteria bacterium]|nr:hypothetical protein [Acidobacteriota bacterium]